MPSEAYDRIRKNLNQVEMRLLRACSLSDRDRNDVTIVAVTKTRSLGEIIAAHGCGLRHFGENRIEALERKVPHLKQSFSQDGALWHMIGHIQSRKASRAVASADVVHSVDSIKLARRLDRFAKETGHKLPVLLELNVSGEESKYGFAAATAEERDRFLVEIQALEPLDSLVYDGLMTMAPLVEDAESTRPVFRGLRELRDHMVETLSFGNWQELSMGMTDDFEIAIQEGATMVRIGRAIFGPRTEG